MSVKTHFLHNNPWFVKKKTSQIHDRVGDQTRPAWPFVRQEAIVALISFEKKRWHEVTVAVVFISLAFVSSSLKRLRKTIVFATLQGSDIPQL